MALRTNTKKAKANLIAYIREATEDGLQGYDNPNNYNTEDNKDLATYIWDIFQVEKYYTIEQIQKRHYPMGAVFTEWLQGLPSCGLGDFYTYHIDNPRDTLADILEETEEEKARYTLEESAQMLATLIYRTIDELRRR